MSTEDRQGTAPILANDTRPIHERPMGRRAFALTIAAGAAGAVLGVRALTSSASQDVGDEATSDEVVHVDGGDIYFEPSEFSIPVGGTIILKNVGAAQHDFAIEGFNDDAPVDMPIGGEEVEFVVPDELGPGEYVFYCTIPGHRQAGMWGTMTVTEAGAEGTPAAGTPVAGTPEAATPAADGQTIQLDGGDIYFDPEELTVSIGDVIEMRNVGAAQHDFAIEGYNDDTPIDLPIGGEVVEWIVPDDIEPGEYVFYCTIPGHRQAGMEGTITIEA